MNWLRNLKSYLKLTGTSAARPRHTLPRLLALEHLETRVVPYAVTGNAWPNPQLITISFVPDGTVVSTSGTSLVTSNLFAAFNGNPKLVNQWQAQILKAAQAWAAQTNINFAVVPDNGAGIGSGTYQQGDPGMGDIRISGYNFGNSTLGRAMMPPPANNYSVAGDIAFNTAQIFNVGSTYDLYTVAMHEFGHALGLDESSAGTSAVMYPNYTGVKPGLSNDDIAGIRAIYSGNVARSNDAYNGANGSFSTASNINSFVNTSSLTATVPNLNLAASSQAEYFTFTAPAGSAGSLMVSVQSSGLSLLAPKVTVYAANQSTVLGSASGLGQYGTTLNVTVNNVTAGQQFYVKVQGADTSAFATGAYALAMNFAGGAAPVAAPPNTQVLMGAVTQGGGGFAEGKAEGDDFLDSVPVVTGITPDTGSSSVDGVTNVRTIAVHGTAPTGNTVRVYQVGTTDQLLGTVVAANDGWTLDLSTTPPGGRLVHPLRHGHRQPGQRQRPVRDVHHRHQHGAAGPTRCPQIQAAQRRQGRDHQLQAAHILRLGGTRQHRAAVQERPGLREHHGGLQRRLDARRVGGPRRRRVHVHGHRDGPGGERQRRIRPPVAHHRHA
jgi:hypothetical protein